MVWDEDTFELNPVQIKALIRLAAFRKNDVFYDIGSGTGKVVIEVAKRKEVEQSIGIEIERIPYERAVTNAIDSLSAALLKKVRFWLGDLDFGDSEKPERYYYNLNDAKVIYYSMDESLATVGYFKRLLGMRHVKIITKNLPLVGYPSKACRKNDVCWFFLTKYPLQRVNNLGEWANSVKPGANIRDVYDYYFGQIKKQYPGWEKYAQGNLLTLKQLVNERF